LQVLVNEMQQRLSNTDAQLSSEKDKARQLERRASTLENERALVAAAEQRLSRMVEELSTEKHKLHAHLQVEQRVSVLSWDSADVGTTAIWKFLVKLILFTPPWCQGSVLVMQASADKEQEYVAERAQLKAETARLQQDLAYLQKSSADEQRHLKNSVLESQAAADRAESRLAAHALSLLPPRH
jgi:cell division protein FtsB